MAVKGMVSTRIIPVANVPSCGFPDDSSKIEPTAAMAATQDPPNNTPLFGVTDHYLNINKWRQFKLCRGIKPIKKAQINLRWRATANHRHHPATSLLYPNLGFTQCDRYTGLTAFVENPFLVSS